MRDDGSHILWAVDDACFHRGFRAPETPGLARFGVHSASWPSDGQIDFRDPGRIWLAAYQNGCDGIVFNAAGKGAATIRCPPRYVFPPRPRHQCHRAFDRTIRIMATGRKTIRSCVSTAVWAR